MSKSFLDKPTEIRQEIQRQRQTGIRSTVLVAKGRAGGYATALNRALRRTLLEAEFYKRALAENRHICPIDDSDPGVPPPSVD